MPRQETTVYVALLVKRCGWDRVFVGIFSDFALAEVAADIAARKRGGIWYSKRLAYEPHVQAVVLNRVVGKDDVDIFAIMPDYEGYR